jgi:hypothetical protein
MDIEYPDPKSNTLLYFASVLPCLTKEVPFWTLNFKRL